MRHKQKFHHGDLVRIADKLPVHMSHFGNEGHLAVVVGSYEDQFGGIQDNWNGPDYTLSVQGGGESSWWPESLLTLVERRGYCRCCGQDVPNKLPGMNKKFTKT